MLAATALGSLVLATGDLSTAFAFETLPQSTTCAVCHHMLFWYLTSSRAVCLLRYSLYLHMAHVLDQ
jgi:hypothetical protein